MDTVKVKRISKKVAKNSFWILSDVFFLGLKIAGTFALIAITTLVVFASIFIYYVRTDLATGLEINPADFIMAHSSTINYVDVNTGREFELVTIQSTEFRRWVDYDEFPTHLINAVVAIEDHRFWTHQGVDWYRTAGAFVNMFLSMSNTFGGSTITQQVIKNLTHEDDVTVRRKLQEIFRALEYERQFGKEEILELYLNLVYFGHGSYGIGAAANYYFDKEVSQLTLPEAAAIISITNNPSRFSPYANRDANKERQETVLFRMHELGYISTEEYRQALRTVLQFQRGIDDEAEVIIYTWFEEAVMRDVVSDMVTRLGWSEQVARRYLFSGGLRIIATIDLEMQAIVDEIYTDPENIPRVTGSAQQIQSGIVLADPYTGEIKALSGGVGIKNRNMLLSRATQTRRPPGSAIKPISAYAPALEYGLLTPDSTYNDSPSVVLRGTTWLPRNANRSYSGVITVRHALRASVNTVSAMVVDQLTVPRSYSFMRDVLGFNLVAADEDYAPLAAGQLTHGATVREMASSFTMFPNSGTRTELKTYSMVYDFNGEVLIDNSEPINIHAISDVTAFWMTDMLVDAVVAGTGGAANLGRMPTAGKTGTSSDSKDRWFVGFSPYYLAAVWTGFDTPARMNSSGNPSAQIWRMVMAPIHEHLEIRQFNRPSDVRLTPVTTQFERETSSFSVIGVCEATGSIIYSASFPARLGSEVSAHAPSLPGWQLVGASVGGTEVTADNSRNIIRFVFRNVGVPATPEPTPVPTPTPAPATPTPAPQTPAPANCSGACGCGGNNACGMPNCTCPVPPTPTPTPEPIPCACAPSCTCDHVGACGATTGCSPAPPP